MKNLAVLFSWFPLLGFLAEARVPGGSLANQKQSLLGVIEAPPAKPGVCQASADCSNGCWCYERQCFGGEPDARCTNQANGHDLGDGGICWDGRRDTNCLAKEPKSSSNGDDTMTDEAMKEAEDQAADTMKKAAKMDAKRMFWKDMELMFSFLMPGKRPNLVKKIPELLLVAVVVVWLVFYKLKLFEDDRCETMGRWAGVAATPRVDDPRIQLMKPDVVLVFHKPDFEYSDKENVITWSIMEKALVSRHGHMPRSEELLAEATAHKGASLGEKLKKTVEKAKQTVQKTVRTAKRAVGRRASLNRTATMSLPADEDAEDSDYEPLTMGEFREALLKDLCEHLPQKGYDVSCFSSVDNDEVFVCIGLRSETTIMQHVQRYGMKLQLKQDVVPMLGIDQPPDEVESSPPYIRYDRRLAENVFGEGKKDLDVFRSFGAHSGKAVIISGTDRIRIIHEHLNHQFDMDYCVSKGLIVQWYPAHAEARIADLQRSWAKWGLLTDLSLRQPISLINEYFGSRVAFIWAWIGLYAKMLLALLPAAVLWEFLNFIASFVGKTDVWHRGSVMGFGIAVVIWGRFAINSWRQEEQYLVTLWDLKHTGKDKSERPDFAGKMEPDVADLNCHTLQYPEWKYTARKVMSWIITLCFCTFVFLCVISWLNLFRGRMTIFASIVQAIMVCVFTQIYNVMAEVLTKAENHKFQDHFYASYLKKMFIFQLVNQYSAFFYMAIKQQFTTEGCPDGDCMGLIRGTLPITLLVVAFLQVVQVFLTTFLVKLNFFLEGWQMKKKGLEPPVYGFVEEQSKFGSFRVREQIEVMTQLSLTLGYVLIFGCIAPRIVPLCFIVFAVQLRAGGVLMTTAVNRTVPRISVGIGPWSEVFNFQLMLGVVFSAYLLVQFGPLFRDTQVITKLTGMFLYGFFVMLVCICVDLACPPTTTSAELLEERRSRVENKVMLHHEDANFQSSGPTDRDSPRDVVAVGQHTHCKEVVDGSWDEVPKLIPDEEGSASGTAAAGP